MTYFGVDDGMSFHRKIVAAGNPAVGLWARAGSWCARYLTDGFVPRDIARGLGTTAQIKALVTVGLWEETQGGYRFHEWTQCNPSAKEVADLRRKRAAAGQIGGRGKAAARQAQEREAAGQGDLFSSNPLASASHLPSKSPSETLANSGTDPYPYTELETSSLVPGADAPAGPSEEPEVSAGDVVARWVDANRENEIEPSQAQCSQVGKLARELLRTNDAHRVLAAARQAGRKGYASIDRELTSMHGQVVPANGHVNGVRPSHTDARVAAGLSLVEELAAEDAARRATPKEITDGPR